MIEARKAVIYSFVAAGVAVTIFLLVLLLYKPPLLEDVSFSRAVFDRNGELLRLTISKDEKYRLFIPLADISPSLKEGVLLHEDQYFYHHAGINPIALVRAFSHSYLGGGRKIGASTITMQLARIKYGINSKSIIGKIHQMTKALQLEMHYSKDELMEAYLNLVPYGYNVEGAGAASFIYFRRKPADLTLPEALTLAVIPQSPSKRRPDNHDSAKPALINARNRLFADWLEEHPESRTQKPFFSLPLATYSIAQLPNHAPHYVNYLLSKYKQDGQITATIDLDEQILLENILERYVTDRREIGINNASAMLVDVRNMQVMASIGSANFQNKSISGQVDGTRARRSPGSALKPFIYGLAFDQGLIHPMSVLGDAPTSFGSYTPDNFDRDFRGPIPARDALRLSRNVPAIKLAAQLHSPDLYQFFKTAGIKKLREKKDYGLSLVLGGAEVTMRELASLYAMLANDGIQRPLVMHIAENEEQEPAKQLLTPEASFMVLDALKDTPRPPTANGNSEVYWKTGTSNGFHDAWTAGIFGHYALVVWVGNFNGKNNPSLVGVLSAAPLFFAMSDAVLAREPQNNMIANKADKLNLRKINVCATTGDITTVCPSMATTWFIPGVSPIKSHDVYRKVLVNIATGKQACSFQTGKTEYRTYEVWPSDLQQTLQKAGIRKTQMPPKDPNCASDNIIAQSSGQKPVITSPQTTITYHSRINASGEAIPLNATSDGDVQNLHWFIGNQYFGKSVPGESIVWRPRPGRYQVRVVDDQGRAAVTTALVAPAQ